MGKLTRQLVLLLCTVVCVGLLKADSIDRTIISELSTNELIEKVTELRTENTEKALELCEKAFEFYSAQKDTFSCIKVLLAESAVYGHKAQYQNSYERTWKAYLLANKANNKNALIQTKSTLGRYFSFYKRDEQALKYLKEALVLNKELVSTGELDRTSLASKYLQIAKTCRELDKPDLARNYLDSCYLFDIKEDEDFYRSLKIEKALHNSDPQKAIDELIEILPDIEKNNVGYQVLIYKYLGDRYYELGKNAEAIEAFLNAIKISDKYKSHIDFSPLIYESLSKAYAQTSEYEKAYQAILVQKDLDELYFDSRSENNRSLLFIRDKYQEEVEEREKLLQQQKLTKLEIEEKEAFLKNILLTICLIFSLLCGALYFVHIKNKHRAEKKLIQKKKELEVKHANELLEMKNRELAVSSLKLIEKDELLSSLKDKLEKGNGDIKREDLKKVIRTISHSNSQNWEEFETRFTSVNRDFYSKLNKKYPKLTNGDQKLCSLIKLNMSSKEMAKLLGISIESVHTNRYRLRKKLALDKSTSLTEFVATL